MGRIIPYILENKNMIETTNQIILDRSRETDNQQTMANRCMLARKWTALGIWS